MYFKTKQHLHLNYHCLYQRPLETYLEYMYGLTHCNDRKYTMGAVGWMSQLSGAKRTYRTEACVRWFRGGYK